MKNGSLEEITTYGLDLNFQTINPLNGAHYDLRCKSHGTTALSHEK